METDLWPHPDRNGGRPLNAAELTAALHALLGALKSGYRDLNRILDFSSEDPAAVALAEQQFSTILEDVAEGFAMVRALRSASVSPVDSSVADMCALALEWLSESVSGRIILHDPGARS